MSASASSASASGPRPAPPPTPNRRRRPAPVQDRGIAFHDAVRVDRWRADGTVKVSGDVEVGAGEVTGTLSVGGKVVAGELAARATIEVDGPVEVRGAFSVRGILRTGSTVHAGELTTVGVLRSAGAVTVDRTATLRGTVHAPTLSVGFLLLDGAAEVAGEVRGGGVRAEFRHRSSLGSVVAPRVRLRGHVPNLVDKVFFHFEPTTVGRVEADHAELEAVDVEFVRAKEVVLGRHAHVREVEGTVVRRHPTSSVGPESKSPPPYGIRR